MGGQNSSIVDVSGNKVVRKCLILLTPPGYEVSKLVNSFPNEFPYRYVSIGQLIRDQINKKTRYSKIILQNLQTHKKINNKILQILLKNTALQGNFMIKFSLLNKQQLDVWLSFMKQVKVQLIIIIKSQIQQTFDSKQVYYQKLKAYKNDIKIVKDHFDSNIIKQFQYQDQITQKVMNFIRQNS